MSEWAIGEGDDDTRTAYEYRELLLDEGIEFDRFRCPFCAIPLTPVNLYVTGEIARTPHFRADKTPHRFGCDGYPVYGGARIQGGERPPRQTEKRDLRLPEHLVPRRRRVAARPDGRGIPTSNDVTAKDVHERRRNEADRLGPAVYGTSLIRTVAIVFLGVFKEGYERQKAHGWADAGRKDWINRQLRASPLTLYDGYKTNYANAVRDTRFPPPPRPRIFHGWGRVTRTAAPMRVAYILRPNQWVERDGGATTHPVEIIIGAQPPNEAPHSQQIVVTRLETAATGLEARWFAYGTMGWCDDGIYRLTVENLDHVYVHLLRKPVE